MKTRYQKLARGDKWRKFGSLSSKALRSASFKSFSGLLGCLGFSPGGCPDTQSIGIDRALFFVTHRTPDKM
jgi:hypothetical protein